MSEMSVSMLLKLVDQVSGPAKGVETELQKLKRATDVLNDIQKGPMKSSKWDEGLKAVQKRRQEIEALQKSEQRAAAIVQTAERETAAAKTNTASSAAAAASQIVSANEKVVASEQRTLSAVERSARQQAAAIQALERQRSRALQRQVEEEHRAARRPPPPAAPVPTPGPGGHPVRSALGMAVPFMAAHLAKDAVNAYREWTDANAIMRPVGDLTAAQQTELKAQQAQLGKDSRYSPVKIAEAQKLLLERGIPYDLIRPYTSHIVNYASAMNVDLPTAVQTIEAHMFSTGKFKDIHSAADADRAIQRSTDINTKLGKLGMSNEDIAQAWEYGGLPGRQAGLSDETMGAMFSLMKRNQIAGSAAGVAMRAISAKLVSPTSQGIAALAAIGVDYSQFVKNGGGLSADGVNAAVDRKFFQKLTSDQRASIEEKLADPEVATDRDKFVNELAPIIAGAFKNKKGEVDKNKEQQVQKLLASVFDKSIEGVDAEGLLRAIIAKHPSLAMLNGFFGFQQGGRAGAALQNPEEFNENLKKLQETPIGFALQIATERLQSFDGALKQLEGSIETLQIKVMSAFDNDGKGGGPLTKGVQGVTGAVNSALEAPGSVTRAGAEMGGVIAAAAGLKSMGMFATMFGQPGSAVASGISSFLGPVGWIATGAIAAQAATDRMEESRLSPKEKGSTYTSDILLGLSQLLQGNFRWRDPKYEDHSAQPVDNSQVDETKAKAESAKQTLDLLNATVQPKVDLAALDQLIAKLNQANAGLDRLGSRARGGGLNFSPSPGALHDGPEAR
jgi:TP901 family phage tail tape measure protein